MKTLMIIAFLFTSSAFAFIGNPADIHLQYPDKNFSSNSALRKVANRCGTKILAGDYGTVTKLNKYKVYSVYDVNNNFVASFQSKGFGTGFCVKPAQ